MKLPESPAGVIKHTVQNDLHVSGMSRFQQLSQSFVATQQRIDVVIIVGVIAMIRGRRKDRTESKSQ